jgi:uncharacterized integral membrane protein
VSTPRDDRVTQAEPTPLDPALPLDPAVPIEPDAHVVVPPQEKLRPTRISGTWIAVIVAIFVLIFLLVFILQNLADVTIHFLGAAGTLPLGVALLFASIAGALLVALVGAARILQLRRQTKRVLSAGAGDQGRRKQH